MPPFGAVLTQDQILYVLAYIKTQWDDDQRGRQRMMTLEEERLMQEAGNE
jgi:mono/diheme cytochrome c family protein